MQVILIKGDLGKSRQLWKEYLLLAFVKANNYPQIGLGSDKAISCNRVDIWEGVGEGGIWVIQR